MYTLTLGTLVENNYNLGMQEYTIFSEEYRQQLNKKITDRFYFNEIGFETPARFIKELNSRLNIIMTYYNALIQAQLKLSNIGFGELLKLSIGYDMQVTSERKTENDTTQKTDNITDDITKTTGDTKTIYNSDDTMVFNTTDTYNQNTTSTTTQTKDTENLTLNADTPQSAINYDLQDKTQWSQSPFVSDGNLQKSNNGEQKTVNTGNDTNVKTGTNTGEKRGTDTNELNTTVTGNNIFDGNQNTNFDGLENVESNTTYHNYDMLTTYKKIIDTIKSIEDLICNDLKILFLQIY